MKKIIYWVILLSPLSTASITRASHIDFRLLFKDEKSFNKNNNINGIFNDLHHDDNIKTQGDKYNSRDKYWIRFSRETLEENGMKANRIFTKNLNKIATTTLSAHLNNYPLATEILSWNAKNNQFEAAKEALIKLTPSRKNNGSVYQQNYAIGLFQTKKQEDFSTPQPQTEKDSSHTLAYLGVCGLVIMAIGLQQLASKKITKQHTNSKPQEDAETKKESV